MPHTCTIDDCLTTARNNTSPYCEKHYSRWRRHGDPLVALKDHTPPEIRWKTSYIEDENGCWVWQGTISRGYGLISCGARNLRLAHKYVWELHHGPVPDGLELDHVCRNRACINPSIDHLEAVTHAENVRRGHAGIANKTKTHCKNGHEFTSDNTMWIHDGKHRQCRTCAQQRYRERQKQLRDKA